MSTENELAEEFEVARHGARRTYSRSAWKASATRHCSLSAQPSWL